MDNQTFMDYIHIMYGKEFSFERDNAKDESIYRQFKELSKFGIYNMYEEFNYLKKVACKNKVELKIDIIDSAIRRGIYIENPTIWKTIWFLNNIDLDRLRKEYRFTEPESKKLAYAYKRIYSTDTPGKVTYLVRSVGVILDTVYRLRRFRLDKKTEEDRFNLLGIKGDTIYIGVDTDYSEGDKYDVDLYKGSIADRELKFIGTIHEDPGEILLNDYKAISKYIDVKDMDIWVIKAY